jgi:hypothetical protein
MSEEAPAGEALSEEVPPAAASTTPATEVEVDNTTTSEETDAVVGAEGAPSQKAEGEAEEEEGTRLKKAEGEEEEEAARLKQKAEEEEEEVARLKKKAEEEEEEAARLKQQKAAEEEECIRAKAEEESARVKAEGALRLKAEEEEAAHARARAVMSDLTPVVPGGGGGGVGKASGSGAGSSSTSPPEAAAAPADADATPPASASVWGKFDSAPKNQETEEGEGDERSTFTVPVSGGVKAEAGEGGGRSGGGSGGSGGGYNPLEAQVADRNNAKHHVDTELTVIRRLKTISHVRNFAKFIARKKNQVSVIGGVRKQVLPDDAKFDIHWNRSELDDRVCKTIRVTCMDKLETVGMYKLNAVDPLAA